MRRFASFDGVSLAYDVWGSGPPVVLLHGFAADSETNWARPGIVETLVEAGRHVVTLDARGHGHSDKPYQPEAYANGAMVKDVQALLDHLRLNEVDVCGYSMGAMTAAAFAGCDLRARSVVLGGVGERVGTRTLGHSAARIAEGLLAEDLESITDPMARAFRTFADNMGADRRALAAIQRSRSMSLQPFQVKIPTLIITGDADILVGSPHRLAEQIPGAVTRIVSGDHLSAVFDPAFGEAIVEFLATASESEP